MRLTTVIILVIVTFVITAKAETTTCFYGDGYAICDTERDPFVEARIEEERQERRDARDAAETYRRNMEFMAEQAASRAEIRDLEAEARSYE